MTASSADEPGGERIALLAGRGLTADRLAGALQRRGVEPVRISRHPGPGGRTADLRDVDSLVAALDEVVRVYVIPPRLDPDEARLVATALEACRRAGVQRVVVHSVLHPHEPDMPHHLRKLAAELHVRHSGLKWTIVQPASYAQNVLRRVRRRGDALVLPSGWPADAPPMAVVDLADVAEAAADVLTRDGDEHATYELAGPEPLTLTEMAAVIESRLGQPVATERWDVELLEAAGAPPHRIADAKAYNEAYGRHGMPGNPRTLEGVLGRPATPFRDVVARELSLDDVPTL